MSQSKHWVFKAMSMVCFWFNADFWILNKITVPLEKCTLTHPMPMLFSKPKMEMGLQNAKKCYTQPNPVVISSLTSKHLLSIWNSRYHGHKYLLLSDYVEQMLNRMEFANYLSSHLSFPLIYFYGTIILKPRIFDDLRCLFCHSSKKLTLRIAWQRSQVQGTDD